jgi:uncharacterized membrane protein
MINQLKGRLLNRGTLAALAAFIIAQLLAHGIIHTTGLASGIQELINDVLNILVFSGIINNAGIGKGYTDVIEEVVNEVTPMVEEAIAAHKAPVVEPTAPTAPTEAPTAPVAPVATAATPDATQAPVVAATDGERLGV